MVANVPVVRAVAGGSGGVVLLLLLLPLVLLSLVIVAVVWVQLLRGAGRSVHAASCCVSGQRCHRAGMDSSSTRSGATAAEH
jgi:hypothetical protein